MKLSSYATVDYKDTSVKIISVRCRDDTVPKTVVTRRHWRVGLRACNNLPQPPKKQDVGMGLWKIVAYVLNPTFQCLLMTTVFGMVSSPHLSYFLHLFSVVLGRLKKKKKKKKEKMEKIAV